MTLKALFNWGGFGNVGKVQQTPVDRWHGGYVGRGGHGGAWEHKSHGHRHYKKGGGKGGGSAAISALTLLAFLFLLNVMQQSLNDNNATVTTATPAIVLRDETTDLTARGHDKKTKSKDLGQARGSDDYYEDEQRSDEMEKGDTLGFNSGDQYS